MYDKNKEIKDYLRLHYSTHDTNKIAKKFNTTADNIRHIAKRLGLKKQFVNDIIENKKICSTCKEVLPISHFYKDKYQKSNLRYECKKCFNALKQITKKKNIENKVISYESSYNHLDKKKNPVIYKNNIAGLKCKVCEQWKPLNEYYKNKKMESGHLNSCKVCEKFRRKRVK